MPILSYKGQHPFVSGATQVPESCIESTEYIMRVMSERSSKDVVWNGAGSGSERHGVTATFGGGFSINISTTENFHTLIPTGTTSYAFTSLPSLGQGLCIVRVKPGGTSPYDMHFGAVFAQQDGQVSISDMSEPENYNGTATAALVSQNITTVGGFRDHNYPEAFFAIGLLTL